MIKQVSKRLSSATFFAVLCLTVTAWSQTAINIGGAIQATGTGFTFANNVLTVNNGANLTITGNTSTRRIVFANNATASITLNNVTIDYGTLPNNDSPISLAGSDPNTSTTNLTITLVGANVLRAGSGGSGAGICVPASPHGTSTTRLTINGTGSLVVSGSAQGAGIGGSNAGAGTITINGGTITASAGINAAGIGGGNGGAGGIVTITNGVVNATGGTNAQGIGRGAGGSSVGTFTMNGNGVVTANSVGDTQASRRTGGILFNGTTVSFHGTSVAPTANFEIPTGRTLTIASGRTLTISSGITMTNRGTITNNGTIIRCGTITGNAVGGTVRVHVWNNPGWDTTTVATCMAAGSRRRTLACTIAGCTQTQLETESIPINPNNHDWGNWGEWITSKEATCTEEGISERTRICRHNAGHTDRAESALPIDPDNHDWDEWSDWEVIKPATCYEEGSAERTRICKHNAEHTESEQDTLPVLTEGCPEDISGEFKDPVFLLEIYNAIGKTAPDRIYIGDVDTITELRIARGKSRDDALIRNLDGIQFLISLKFLDVSGHDLREVNLSNNAELEHLNASGNQLTRIDITNNIALKFLDVDDNRLSEIDLSSNPALEHVNLSGNQLTRIDVTHNIALKFLDVDGNRFASESEIVGIREGVVLNYGEQSAVSITNAKKSVARQGIIFAKNPASDKAEISVVLPNGERAVEANVVIYDMTGNVVWAVTARRDPTVWDLRNSAGRFVANGTYLVIAEVKDHSGRTHTYSARLGVKR